MLRHLYGSSENFTRHLNMGDGKAPTVSHKLPGDLRVAYVHFHPDIVDDLAEQAGKKIGTQKWRVPLDVGKKIGLTDVDLCSEPGPNGETSFFALPNYSMEDAAADVEKAERIYHLKIINFHRENQELIKDVATDPLRYALEIEELKCKNAALMKENVDLRAIVRAEEKRKRKLEEKFNERLKSLKEAQLDDWLDTY